MNDPNKAISVNLSSLLSLKAELLRKQAEVKQTKATRTPSVEYSANSNATAPSSSSKHKDSKQRVKELSKDKDKTVFEHEDSELLAKSQRVLQAKSKFYERMTRTGGKLNSDDNCLVLFNRKQQDERDDPTERRSPPHPAPSSDSEASASSAEEDDHDDKHQSDDSHEGPAEDPDDDWVEYTDCLGRTRKCLRRDLSEVKRRDEELAASMPERLDQSKANWMIDTKGEPQPTAADNDQMGSTMGPPAPPESFFSDGCSLMSKHDEQRANWERKEQENFDKVDVHYQDVFFDEARQHGVGYYAFSTDEEERRRQQAELEESRKRTVTEQERRDNLRAQREKIIAERVRAAKNRQRARLGLPPLEEEEQATEQAKKAAEAAKETKEERKERKRAEKVKRRQEQEEAERERERQEHVRPWDADKKLVTVRGDAANGEETEEEWRYKPERLPLSQEEWNEQKRAERVQEFAPPQAGAAAAAPKRTNFSCVPPPPPPMMVPPPQHFQRPTTMPTAQQQSLFNMMMAPPPPPPPLPFKSHDSFNAFQTTSKREQQFKRRNYVDSQDEPVSMRDTHGGAEIPPPANLDAPHFSMPPHTKKSKSSIELERSIEAGLRFLRQNCDKSVGATKSTWTAKADY